MDSIEIRRANVMDAAEAVFDAYRVVEPTATLAHEVEQLLELSDELPRRGLGRSLIILRRAVKECASATERLRTTADEMSSLLGEFVAHAGRPDATPVSVHRRFERATARHDQAFDAAVDSAARAGRFAAGAASLHGPTGEDPLWEHALEILARVGFPPDTGPFPVPDDPSLDVFLTGLAAHVGERARAFAIIQVEGTKNRFVQLLVAEDGQAVVESVGDGMLSRAERLRKADLAYLDQCGLNPPDEDRPNWHIDFEVASASRIGTLAADILRRVHRFAPPASLLITNEEDHGEEVVGLTCAIAGSTGPELAASLAQRILEELEDGVRDAWVTVAQYGDDLGWSGHLRIENGEPVGAELRYLIEPTSEQRRLLMNLGWEDDPLQEAAPLVATSSHWGGVDVDEAAALVVHTLVDVLGVEPTRPVAGVVVPYE